MQKKGGLSADIVVIGAGILCVPALDLWPNFRAELTDTTAIDLQYERNGGLTSGRFTAPAGITKIGQRDLHGDIRRRHVRGSARPKLAI
jgi:hypothetical protein